MKKISILILFILSALPSFGQNFNGQVFYRRPDGKTEPLPYAQVYFLEKSKLLDTDGEGRFTISNYGTKATLVATYVGYTRDTLVVTPEISTGEFFLSGENEVEQSVVTARQPGISKLKPVKTEVISAAGLCKMACCALAESFENSASVTVGYSDAVTGAKQIKLLGLSGTYTQMLDENRPVMRGLANPFGLSYVPGQWLESIQIAKGPSSVINGLEAITGQINMEHRKPTDETPLFVQLYGSSDSMYEANVVSALQFSPAWSTILLTHVGGTSKSMDHNGDGFRDEPENLQINVANRWLYYHQASGLQIRFGARFINENRVGGQMGSKKDNDYNIQNNLWGSNILNRGINGYMKIGVPVDPEQTSSIAAVLDFNHHEFDSYFFLKDFDGKQDSWFLNLLYQNNINDYHAIEFGITAKRDGFKQVYTDNRLALSAAIPYKPTDMSYIENSVAVFGEYTYTLDEKVTLQTGLNLEHNWLHGWMLAPRANFKYAFTDEIIFRLLGGRGFRCSNIFTDNLGMFSTGRVIKIQDALDTMEDAWTYGGNVTFYLPFGFDEENTYLSFDYFHNDFLHQVIVDQEAEAGYVDIYNLDGRSFTNTYQVDFNVDPFERFNVVATFRYTDARVTLQGQGLVERPMTSRYKGVLNLQYSTPMSKWVFDFTAQINGPMKLPWFAAEAWGMETSPIYPMLYAQITRKFRGIDIYIGGENLTGFHQMDAILSAKNPFSPAFNASCVWGPL
ncbi:MAG: carboxypeptidase-like regulatory domain-containing protein, partial [Bacteroidales bacterium]|nr:carboxypeptidase-like regulatory domain-containing protein [Bacteroidales bacterium]